VVEKLAELEKRLWSAADQLRANSTLAAHEYSVSVLELIFLRFADVRFTQAQKELTKEFSSRRRSTPGREHYQARGVLFLPNEARFSKLLELPEGADIGSAVNGAMRAIESENSDLKDVLPKSYNRLENATLIELMKLMASIPMDIEGDAFGRIYEYFLGSFALSEGRGGGEFFTPTAIVKLIVEIIEPFHGRIFDPACGSGGMFVQSARFVREHRKTGQEVLSVHGQEGKTATARLARMNMAVHGLGGDIRQGNTYYEDLHHSGDKFDFVMANHRSMWMRWTRSGSRMTRVSLSACRARTMPITSGFSSFIPRSTRRAAPVLSWPTPLPMHVHPKWRSERR